ncbi:MAG: T9SS type A sorting domain-containing protein, partial [Bacteroidota bacterium]
TVVVGAYGHEGTGGVQFITRQTGRWRDETVQQPTAARWFDQFGTALDVSGTRAIIGASGATSATVPLSSGVAYVFERDTQGWTETARLMAEGVLRSDRFGSAIALDGDWALVGAPATSAEVEEGGAVYAFAFNGINWQLAQRITVAEPEPSDFFGAQLVLDGDRALIYTTRGVHVYEHTGSLWVQTATLQPTVSGQSGFGLSLALDEDRAVVGAPFQGGPSYAAGVVYVFDYVDGAWELAPLILARDGNSEQRFLGRSVGVDGDLLVAGASGDQELGPDAGAAYVFEHDGTRWRLEAKLNAFDAAASDRFGSTVAVSGGRVLSALGLFDNGEPEGGAVYVFERGESGWAPREKLVAYNTASGDGFGSAIALAPQVALIGAPSNDNEGGLSAGAAYFYDGLPVSTENPSPDRLQPTRVYPNPAQSTMTVVFELATTSPVEVEVYDLLGQHVARVHDGPLGAGDHQFTVPTGHLASGVYLVRIRYNDRVETRRVSVVR